MRSFSDMMVAGGQSPGSRSTVTGRQYCGSVLVLAALAQLSRYTSSEAYQRKGFRSQRGKKERVRMRLDLLVLELNG
jgi:hypothetical protein